MYFLGGLGHPGQRRLTNTGSAGAYPCIGYTGSNEKHLICIQQILHFLKCLGQELCPKMKVVVRVQGKGGSIGKENLRGIHSAYLLRLIVLE